MKQNFVHLHNHTDFSLLDAAQSVDQMCNRLNDLQMDTIAVTEHGNLFSMNMIIQKNCTILNLIQMRNIT